MKASEHIYPAMAGSTATNLFETLNEANAVAILAFGCYRQHREVEMGELGE